MKAKLMLITLVCFGGYFLSSCGNGSSDYDEETANKLTSEYRDALKTQDFEKAHDVLDKVYSFYDGVVNNRVTDFWGDWDPYVYNMKSATSFVCDAIKSIYSEEIRFLVSSNAEGNWERVLYLLSEIKSIGKEFDEDVTLLTCDEVLADSYQEYVKTKNSLCNLCLDLAINQDNKHVAKKLLRYYVRNCIVEFSGVKYSMKDINEAKEKYQESFDEPMTTPETSNED